MGFPTSFEKGARWFNATSATNAYPTNGQGGATTTQADSELDEGSVIVLVSATFFPIALAQAAVLTITTHTGGTVGTFVFGSAVANTTEGGAAPLTPYRLELGWNIVGGIRANTSNAAVPVSITYQIVKK